MSAGRGKRPGCEATDQDAEEEEEEDDARRRRKGARVAGTPGPSLIEERAELVHTVPGFQFLGQPAARPRAAGGRAAAPPAARLASLSSAPAHPPPPAAAAPARAQSPSARPRAPPAAAEAALPRAPARTAAPPPASPLVAPTAEPPPAAPAPRDARPPRPAGLIQPHVQRAALFYKWDTRGETALMVCAVREEARHQLRPHAVFMAEKEAAQKATTARLMADREDLLRLLASYRAYARAGLVAPLL